MAMGAFELERATATKMLPQIWLQEHVCFDCWLGRYYPHRTAAAKSDGQGVPVCTATHT